MAVERIQSAEEFRAATAAARMAVVCFSAPWCGACKLVAPQIEALSQELGELRFVGVSADNMEPLIEELEVASFPTFRIYKDSKMVSEFSSAKFDKVEEFIRSHLTAESPEADAKDEGDASDEVPIADAVTPPMSPVESACGSEKDQEESVPASNKRSEREETAEDEVHAPSPKKTKTDHDAAVQESNVPAAVATDDKMAGEDTDETLASIDTVATMSEDVEIPEEDEAMAAADGQEASVEQAEEEVTATGADEEMADVEVTVAFASGETAGASPTEVVAVECVAESKEHAEADSVDTTVDVAENEAVVIAASTSEETPKAATATDGGEGFPEAINADTIEALGAASTDAGNGDDAMEDTVAEAPSSSAETTEKSPSAAEESAVQDMKTTELFVSEAVRTEEATETTTAEHNTEGTEQSVAPDAEATKSVDDGSAATEDNAVAA